MDLAPRQRSRLHHTSEPFMDKDACPRVDQLRAWLSRGKGELGHGPRYDLKSVGPCLHATQGRTANTELTRHTSLAATGISLPSCTVTTAVQPPKRFRSAAANISIPRLTQTSKDNLAGNSRDRAMQFRFNSPRAYAPASAEQPRPETPCMV